MRKTTIILFTVFFFLATIDCISKRNKVNIWLIGDSTMAWKKPDRKPESGWGEGLKQFVNEDAEIHNHAASGRSTKSFINEKRWIKVVDSINKGDFVIIQFGHNDEKEDSLLHTEPFGAFKENLKKFVAESQAKGANPVVCSSITRRHFDTSGKLIDTHGDYITAAKQVAEESNIPYVDMNALTSKLVSEMGPDYSKAIYNFTKHKQDSTHLNFRGAKVVAFLFAKNVTEQNLPLSQYLDIKQSMLIW